MMQIGLVGMGTNGFMNHIMQSDQDYNKIMKTCEELLAMGYGPAIVIEHACSRNGININSLTDVDKQRLIKKVEEVYNSNRTRRDR